jgi:hypothetical protein
MKRIMLLPVFLIACSCIASGDTFFICTDEKCNEEAVPLNEQAREGIFDGLFEAGHIVLDDCTAKFENNIFGDKSVTELLETASESLVPFLVIVRVVSRKTILTGGKERIRSEARYSLYNVNTNTPVGSGTLNIDNTDKEDTVTRGALWFQLGRDISINIQSIYDEYMKK